MKDTFNTTGYKGHFIHSCYDRKTNKEIITTSLHQNRQFKSYHAAKLAIRYKINMNR